MHISFLCTYWVAVDLAVCTSASPGSPSDEIELVNSIYTRDHFTPRTTTSFPPAGVTSAADVGSLRLHDLTALGIQVWSIVSGHGVHFHRT